MTDSFYYYGGRHVEREILSALIDGELSPQERRFVHEHLQECAACREAADEFGHIHGMVGELPRFVAPESVVSKALRPARPTVAQLFLKGKRKFVAGGLALSAVGITVAGLFVPQRETTPPVDVFFERQVSLHAGDETGAQVLFAVNDH